MGDDDQVTAEQRERSGRREQNKAENRTALLKAARAVFAEMGFGAAGVRDIVRRTDLASGTFYNYFKDKDEIFEAVVGELTGELLKRHSNGRAKAHDGRGILPRPLRRSTSSSSSRMPSCWRWRARTSPPSAPCSTSPTCARWRWP